jgi:hypothetical protein
MKPKQKAVARSLATIVGEIRKTLRNDIGNIIKRGDLLLEAKDQLEHGEWLPWLAVNFLMDERTAQRAMAAAKFAAKYDGVSDLRLTKSALYDLSSRDYPAKVIKAVLNEAKSSIVNDHRVWEIEEDLNPPKPEPTQDFPEHDELKERLRAEAELDAEAEKILDGPPPDLPPAEPPPAPVDFVLTQFNNAIKALAEVHTKSLNRFTGTTHTADELRKVADFLFAVANAVKSDRVIEGSCTEISPKDAMQ